MAENIDNHEVWSTLISVQKLVLWQNTTVVGQVRSELRPKALLFGRNHYSKMLVYQAQIVGRILVHNDKLFVLQAQFVGRIMVQVNSFCS